MRKHQKKVIVMAMAIILLLFSIMITGCWFCPLPWKASVIALFMDELRLRLSICPG